MGFLPKTISPNNTIIKEFHGYVWKTHNHRPRSMIKHLHDYDHPVIKSNFSPRDILVQILIFLLPNWKKMWKLFHLPLNYEICKRLMYLKEEERWIPSHDALTRLILQFP